MRFIRFGSLLLVLAAVFALSVTSVAAQDGSTIVDIAVSDGRFDTLVAAVQAANLVDTLNSDGPFTVFAPTDDAFAALGEDTINALIANPSVLAQVLTYHVVPGERVAADVIAARNLTSVQGGEILVTVNDDGVFLNEYAQVIITDIQASNGVIHVIDAVILPPVTFEGEDLYLVTGDAPVLGEPGGAVSDGTVLRCQTFFVDAAERGYFHLRDIDGWVDARIMADVAEDYGQPGGQAAIAGC